MKTLPKEKLENKNERTHNNKIKCKKILYFTVHFSCLYFDWLSKKRFSRYSIVFSLLRNDDIYSPVKTRKTHKTQFSPYGYFCVRFAEFLLLVKFKYPVEEKSFFVVGCNTTGLYLDIGGKTGLDTVKWCEFY